MGYPDIELVCRKSDALDDWYVIDRKVHDGTSELRQGRHGGLSFFMSSRISDADVEGRAAEMLAIADAIDADGSVSFRRCAVDCVADGFEFYSPRNSTVDGCTSAACAKRLAVNIREVVASLTSKEDET